MPDAATATNFTLGEIARHCLLSVQGYRSSTVARRLDFSIPSILLAVHHATNWCVHGETRRDHARSPSQTILVRSPDGPILSVLEPSPLAISHLAPSTPPTSLPTDKGGPLLQSPMRTH